MSILSLMMQGGILMYVLLLLSIAVLAIVIEKYRQLAIVRKANLPVLELLQAKPNKDALQQKLQEGHAHSPIAQVLKKVMAHDTQDIELITQSLESAANYELHQLEKGMGWLSTFSAIAPLIGFLGTVLGMVRVFMNIEHQSSAGIDINILAGGIWEAMLTTIGGLIVGIIAIVFYNDIITRLENILHDMQDSTSNFLIHYYK